MHAGVFQRLSNDMLVNIRTETTSQDYQHESRHGQVSLAAVADFVF